MLIDTESLWLQFTDEILSKEKLSVLVIDTETTGLDLFPRKGVKRDRIIGFSLMADSKVCYVPVQHERGQNLESDWAPRLIALMNKAEEIWFFNLQYDYWILNFAGIEIPKDSRTHDVFVMSMYIDDAEESRQLKQISIRRISEKAAYEEARLKQLIKERHYKRFSELSPEEILNYAIQDVRLTRSVGLQYKELLSRQPYVLQVYQRDMQMIWLYIDIVRQGLKIDAAKCRDYAVEAIQNMQRLQLEFAEETGIPDFNPGSPTQITRAFGFDVSDDVNLIRSKHRFGEKTMEYRGWSKVLTSFYEPMFEGFNVKNYPFSVGGIGEDGKVHPDLLMAGTVTSRTICTKPPMQGLPRMVKSGTWEPNVYKTRNIIIPSHSSLCLVSFDYDQVEFRFVAHYSMDDTLVNAFNNGDDLHALTARNVWGNVTQETRQDGKIVNFSCIFLIGDHGLATYLAKTRRITTTEEAHLINTRFHRAYPRIKVLYNTCRTIVSKRGFIETWTGRRCHLKEDEDYKAMSRLIQTSAAELIKYGIFRAQSTIAKYEAHIVLQVHDEILLEMPIENLAEGIPEIEKQLSFTTTLEEGQKAIFTQPVFRVPMTVSTKFSTKSWGEMEKWDENPSN